MHTRKLLPPPEERVAPLEKGVVSATTPILHGKAAGLLLLCRGVLSWCRPGKADALLYASAAAIPCVAPSKNLPRRSAAAHGKRDAVQQGRTLLRRRAAHHRVAAAGHTPAAANSA
jgi:hypothetical protein